MNEYHVTTVRKDFLKGYLEEYHMNNSHGRCKADGQKWPCEIYSHLYYAVFGKEPVYVGTTS